MRRMRLGFAWLGCAAAACGCFAFGLPAGRAQPEGPPPARTVAPKAPERFALLVGIDQYQHERPLQGATEDVKAMRTLLTSTRFGFANDAAHIRTLTDGQATRAKILNAFREHLIGNARIHANAIIVFHFSGHGSQVQDEEQGDELDGQDETLVPVESQDAPGKNTDIVDDEVDALFEELSQYTPNITFILDSCHSASGTRGPSRYARQAPARTHSRPPAAAVPGPRGGARRDGPLIDFLPPNQRSVTIAACQDEELADVTRKAGKVYGALTFHLIRALERSTATTTYREVMAEVAPAVNHELQNQNPQAEGDLDRRVFGGAGDRKEPWIGIAPAGIRGRRITLEAGEAHGISVGTLLALYAPDAPRLAGEEGKLATATVTAVNPTTAIAEMPEASPIPPTAKVVLVSPLLGTARLRVALPPGDPVLAAVAAQLREGNATKNLVEALPHEPRSAEGANDPTAWDGAVLKAPLAEVFPEQRGETGEVYYLATRSVLGQPLFGFFARADNPQADALIVEALGKWARQRSLRALENRIAPASLQEKIRLTVLDADAGNAIQPVGSSYAFALKRRYLVQIENQSDKNLHVTLFDVSSDGSIQIMWPPPGANNLLAGKQSVKTGDVWETAGPPGPETLKVIATTKRTNHQFFAQGPVIGDTRGTGLSPLEQLFNQLVGGQTRSAPVVDDEWVTGQIEFHISGAHGRAG